MEIMVEMLDAGVTLFKLSTAVIHALDCGQDGDLPIETVGDILLVSLPIQRLGGCLSPLMNDTPDKHRSKKG